jgi:predicted ester cyclase
MQTPELPSEAGVDIVRRFLNEVVNGGNNSVIPELWTDDMVWHGGSMGEIHGVEAYEAYMRRSASGAFSDMHLEVKHVVSAGDDVVVRFTNSGSQTGYFMGTPPTQKHAEWLGIAIYTLRDGKIAEAWFGEDILGMMLQLGTITLPKSGTER